MRELVGKAAGDERLYLTEDRAGRLDDSDIMPATAGGEVVTRPLHRIP